MDFDKFEKLFDDIDSEWDGDNAYQGLQIIAKYTENLIQGADHDIIWSEGVDKLIEGGITEEEVIKLAKLNWMIEAGYLACYV
jgi:hypothetical protein